MITRYLPLPASPAPRTIATDAPNAAADEIPIVYGLTRGFLIVPCIAAPATARPAPAMIPSMIRGNRAFQTIAMAISLLATPIKGNILATRASKTSLMLRLAAPR